MDEQGTALAELTSALESQRMEMDNRLTEQQQQYEMQINDLLNKLSEKETDDVNPAYTAK